MSADQRKLPIRAAALPLTTLLLIVTGLALRAGSFASQAHPRLAGGACCDRPAADLARTVRGMVAGRFAADLVAMLAIVTALLLDQPLPGLVVVLMQSGGEALEAVRGGPSLGGSPGARGRGAAGGASSERGASRGHHGRGSGRWAIACWYAPGRWFPAMERWRPANPTWTPRASRANRCRSGPNWGSIS